MITKKSIVLISALGALLLGVFTSTAQAQDTPGFTINGQSTYGYSCNTPCPFTLNDPDGGTYRWDFDYLPSQGFETMAVGNPVSGSFEKAGDYGIAQADENGNLLEVIGINVTDSDEAAPEDIEYVGPSEGRVGLEYKITTSRKNVVMTGDFFSEFLGRSGPVDGLYMHRFRIVRGEGSGFLNAEAWNSNRNFSVVDSFPLTITGGDPINVRDGKAAWKVSPKDDKCEVRLKKSFESVYRWSAKLRFKGKGTTSKVFRKSGKEGEGSQFTRGKTIVKPGTKVTAILKVTSYQTFTFKDKKKISC